MSRTIITCSLHLCNIFYSPLSDSADRGTCSERHGNLLFRLMQLSVGWDFSQQHRPIAATSERSRSSGSLRKCDVYSSPTALVTHSAAIYIQDGCAYVQGVARPSICRSSCVSTSQPDVFTLLTLTPSWSRDQIGDCTSVQAAAAVWNALC